MESERYSHLKIEFIIKNTSKRLFVFTLMLILNIKKVSRVVFQ